MSKKEHSDKDLNVFELLNKIDELPPELKKQVMATINFAHLASDLGKLFSVDMAKTAGRIIDQGLNDGDCPPI